MVHDCSPTSLQGQSILTGSKLHLREMRAYFMSYLFCPLWVISGHMQCNGACPLSANSGHALTSICDQDAMNRPNRRQVDTSANCRRGFISVIEGPSPGDASSAASSEASRLVPATRSICCKTIGISGPQRSLFRRQFPLPPHDFKHDLRLGLANHDQTINFTHLDCAGCCRDGGLRNQRSATVCFARSLES